MSGNFGGNSIPTSAVDAAALFSGASTTYSTWNCTKVIAVRTTVPFVYDGVTIIGVNAPVGESIDLIMNPSLVGSIGPNVYTLLCYDCGCETPVVSPVIITSGDTNYKNYGPSNKPIVIGGGGLNS